MKYVCHMTSESKKQINFVSHLEWGKEIKCHAKEYVKFTTLVLENRL